MSTPVPPPTSQADLLAVLLDALDGVPITDSERRSLEWLAGGEAHTVENLAAVITRARSTAEHGTKGGGCDGCDA